MYDRIRKKLAKKEKKKLPKRERNWNELNETQV